MKLLCSLLAILLAIPARGAEKTLYLESSLREESQSEEGILLIQCLTGEGGFSWELGSGRPQLRLTPGKDNRIDLTLLTEKETIHRSIPEGSLLLECEGLRKALDLPKGSMPNLAPPPRDLPPIPSGELTDEAPKSNLLPWALGAGAAILIGGFFYWKAKQPRFQRIESGAP